jgi:hypothetical protein
MGGRRCRLLQRVLFLFALEIDMADQPTKPYVKIASTLVLVGMGIFTLERFGLQQAESPGQQLHLGSTLLSLLVLVPVAMVVAGALVFVVGKMRRL